VVVALFVWALPDLALLLGYAVLLAYALLPLVGALERVRLGRARLSRGVAAGVVTLALVVLAGALLVVAVPRLAAQAAHFVARVPAAATRLLDDLRAFSAARGLEPLLGSTLDSLRADAPTLVQNLGGTLAGGLRWLFGSVGQALGLLLLPLLAFYLLAEAEAVQASGLRFVPGEARGELIRLGAAVDRALRSYVRGQAIVCLVMALGVGLALAAAQLPLALLLGVMVGFAELVPYVGFTIAALAIGLTGFSVSPAHALIGILLYVVINWAVGTFVTPRVMGRYLRMHPFVITVSVLAGAKLLGPAGAVLALPGAAVIQALVGELASDDAAATGAAQDAARD